MRRFINILEEVNDIPSALYHATYLPYMDNILKHGIDPFIGKPNWDDSKNVVYLANDPYVAESYAESAEEVDEDYLDLIIVLMINASELNQSMLSADSNVIDGDSTFEYDGIIKPSLIKAAMTNSADVHEYCRKHNIMIKGL